MTENRNDLVAAVNDRRRVVPWNVRDALQGIALVAAGSFIIVVVFDRLKAETGPENATLLVPLALALLPGLLVLAAWGFGIRRYRAPWRSLGFRPSNGQWGMVLPLPALLLSLSAGGIYAAAIQALGFDSLLPPALPAGVLGEGLHRALNTVTIGVLGPLAEEIFFRGFLLAALVPSLGPFRAAGVGSIVFAVSHLSVGVIVPFFVSGLLLSWLYLKTRSIWPPFAAHAAQNLIALSLTP